MGETGSGTFGAKPCAMKELTTNSIYLLLALALLTLAGCATQPSATTSDSAMNRNNGNGLASYMH
jgi:uncharacterized lipoprotein YajG